MEAAAALLHPRSVVIVGASDRSRWSQGTFANLTEGGFRGRVHLVNPRGGAVHGRQAAPSCGAIGEQVDLGVVLVPGHATADAVRELGACGTRSAVVLTSGFAETGVEGRAAQAALAEAARSQGIRLLGPNSLGFINFVDPAPVWTTPIRAPSRREGVAIVSQSGATAFFLTNLAYQWDVGLSYVVATGNEADLGCTDFAHALVNDPATRAVALFIETVRDPAGFLAVAEAAVGAKKPLIVLKVGASEVTAKSALAHTGALVGDDRVFDGICQQFGAIRVRSIEDLLATADMAARAGPLRPGGLGVISNSGGICEIAADCAEARGVALPPLTDEAQAALRQTIPGFATAHNPLDLTGAITPEQCGAVVEIMAAQPEFAALLIPYYEVPTTAADISERLTGLHGAQAQALREANIPGFVCSYTSTHLNELSRRIQAELGLPYLACGLDRALTGLSGLFGWSQRLQNPLPLAGEGRVRVGPQDGTQPPSPPPSPASGRGRGSDKPRSEFAALQALASHGVPVVPMHLVANEDAAAAAATGFGAKVVLKIASPDILHKSDIGGVALNLEGPDAVRAAFHRVMAAAPQGAQIDGVLVAPMRERGLELFVGVSRDPQWGPVLAAGLGGVWVEVLEDVGLRLLPVEPAEIKRMLGALRGAKLLAGQRGVPAADLDAVAAAIARIGDAALAFGPDLAAMDVNPLWVRGDQVEALDALCVWQDA